MLKRLIIYVYKLQCRGKVVYPSKRFYIWHQEYPLRNVFFTFLSDNVLNHLVERYSIALINMPEADIAELMKQ